MKRILFAILVMGLVSGSCYATTLEELEAEIHELKDEIVKLRQSSAGQCQKDNDGKRWGCYVINSYTNETFVATGIAEAEAKGRVMQKCPAPSCESKDVVCSKGD